MILRLPRKHARTHLPGGTDPLAVSSTIVPFVNKTTAWGRNITTTDGFNIDDLADFGGAYGSNDPDEIYFSDYSDSSLGYSREAIEIHHAGLYLFDWGASFSLGATGSPLYLTVYPNSTESTLDEALDFFRLLWPANYDHLVASAAYGTARGKRLGGCAYYLLTDDDPLRFALRIESKSASANWGIGTIQLQVSRLGDLGTLA